MEYDSLGLLFIGLSLMFLIAVLFGHQKREHMSNQASAWDNIRFKIEKDAEKDFDFNVTKFRSNVINQNKFFDIFDKDLTKLQQIIGIHLSKPLPAEVKDTEKLFDEKIRLIKEAIVKAKKDSKSRMYIETMSNMSIQTLTSMAKLYMITSGFSDTNAKPKSGLSTISKILG